MSVLREDNLGGTLTLNDAANGSYNNGRAAPYFSDEVAATLTPEELAAITTDWDTTNARRGELIYKEVYHAISPAEQAELDALQHLASMRVRLVAPLPLKALEAVIEDLKRRGMWDEED